MGLCGPLWAFMGPAHKGPGPLGCPVSCQGFVALARTRALGHHRLETTFFTGSGEARSIPPFELGPVHPGLASNVIFIGYERRGQECCGQQFSGVSG